MTMLPVGLYMSTSSGGGDNERKYRCENFVIFVISFCPTRRSEIRL